MRRITLLLVLAAFFALLAAGPAHAQVPRAGIYDVTIRGNAEGVPFARTGTLFVLPRVTNITTNGRNPVDVCLFSGRPFTSPQSGSIWLHSNSYCVNTRGARLDMAFVSMSLATNRVFVRPDSRIAAVGVNGFNINSGLLANVYQIYSGAESLAFRNRGRTVVGTVNVLGTGAIFPSSQRYSASLSGTARSIVPRQQAATSGVQAKTQQAREDTHRAIMEEFERFRAAQD